MIYRTLTSMMIWICASLMVLIGKLRDRDLGIVLAAASVNTIAVWAMQPTAATPPKMPHNA